MIANKRVGAGTTAGPVMCGSDGNRMMDSQPDASSSNREKVTRGVFFFLFFLRTKKKKEPRQLRHAAGFQLAPDNRPSKVLTTLKIKPTPPLDNLKKKYISIKYS